MKFTVKSTDGLQLPRGKTDLVAFDDALPGFGLRLRAGGSRNWIIQYETGNRQRRMVIGSAALPLDEARASAARLLAQVKLGADPAGVKAENQAKAGETFAACMKIYLERRRNEPDLRASTYREIERHLIRNLRALHGMHISAVDRRAIAIELARCTSANGPVQANRTRGSLVKFLNWCAGEGFIDANPAQFTNKNVERGRDRTLTDSELCKIWRALPEGDFGDILKLLALTAARANEIAQLRWGEVDFERGVIALPGSRTKNHRAHFIPMGPTVRAILESRPQSDGRDLVFGRDRDQSSGFSGWSKSKLKLDAAVKIPAWVIHDIRRSVATGLGELGIQPHIVEAVLNHVSGSRAGVAGLYNKAQYEAEKTTALARWDEHVAAVLADRKTNVRALKRPA